MSVLFQQFVFDSMNDDGNRHYQYQNGTRGSNELSINKGSLSLSNREVYNKVINFRSFPLDDYTRLVVLEPKPKIELKRIEQRQVV